MTLCHNCNTTRSIYTGNGNQLEFSFSWEYYAATDIRVANWDPTLKVWSNVPSTDPLNNTVTWSLSTAVQGGLTVAVVTFTNAPAQDQEFIIYRCTDLSPLPAQFNAGSSIKAQDLNDNFFVLQSAIEEARCSIERQSEVSDERYLQELSDDTTPQLGGDLDLNGMFLDGILKVKRSNNNIQPEIRFLCTHHDDSGTDSHDGFSHYAAIKAPSASDFDSNYHLVFQLPHTSGNLNQVLTASNVSEDQVTANGVTTTRYTTTLGWTDVTAKATAINLIFS